MDSATMRAAAAETFARGMRDIDIWRTVRGHNHADERACHARCPRVTQTPAVTRMLMLAAYGPRERTVFAH
jgi:hypothetical protein